MLCAAMRGGPAQPSAGARRKAWRWPLRVRAVVSSPTPVSSSAAGRATPLLHRSGALVRAVVVFGGTAVLGSTVFLAGVK